MSRFIYTYLTNKQIQFIENVKIGRMFIDEEHIKAIKEVFNLENITDENTLRGLRNSIVEHLGEKAKEYKETDFDKSMQFFTNISGLTCVIDSKLFSLGYAV